MRKKINYTRILVLVVLLISYSCKDEKEEISLFSTKENYVPEESQTTPSGVGTRLYDFPGGGRKYAVSFSIGTKIFIGFGFENLGALKDFWELDYNKANNDSDLITENLWIKLPDFPGSFSKNGVTEGTPLGFAVNGKGYVLPGPFWDNGNLVNEFWEFDPETNLWNQKASPPANLSRYFATGFSIGTKIYIGTGESYFEDQWKLYKDFWEWDQITDTWSQRGDFPGAARAHAIGFSIGNKGYIGLGGEVGMGGGPFYNDFWEYDQIKDSWTRKADFPGTQQIDAVAFSAGNKGYVTAGWDPMSESTSSQDIWEWNQTTDTWTKIGDFAGTPRTGAVGATIGNRGYLLTGQNLSKNWEFNPLLNDFWLFDLTSD